MKDIFRIIFVLTLVAFLSCGAAFVIFFLTREDISLKNFEELEAKVFLSDFYQYDFSEGEELILDYFDDKNEEQEIGKEIQLNKKKILGGIVSHHLPLAFPLIADFYKNLEEENPEVIFVLGPDHFHRASSRIVSTKLPFHTPFGYLETDKNIVEKLQKENLIDIDNEVFKNEHSILSQTFFLKYLFPRAKIVPLIFQPDLDVNDAKNIAKFLEPFKEKAVFISSVDFSHYLSLNDAQRIDRETKEKLENSYFENLSIEECDSPVSIQVLFFLAKQDKYNFEVLQVKNSADFSQIKDSTTGYISAVFHYE